MFKRYASERSAIGDPVIWSFISDINRTPKRFMSESGTYHVRRTVKVFGKLIRCYGIC